MKNPLLVSAASAAVALGLVLGGAGAANAASPSPAPSGSSSASTSDCTFGQHLVHAWLEVPKALRTDLENARKAGSRADRLKDLKAIRTKALAGGYGDVVQQRAQELKSLDLRPLPDALKADLKTLHGETTKADKVKEADAIAQKALAGDYGDQIQTLAKKVQASPRWQDCTPGAAKQSTGSGS